MNSFIGFILRPKLQDGTLFDTAIESNNIKYKILMYTLKDVHAKNIHIIQQFQ